MTQIFKIVPTTQKYDWGKIGLSSKVAQYAAAAKIPGFTLDEKAPYAEVSTTLVLVTHTEMRQSCGWGPTQVDPPMSLERISL